MGWRQGMHSHIHRELGHANPQANKDPMNGRCGSKLTKAKASVE
jgi:hypothetical protein